MTLPQLLKEAEVSLQHTPEPATTVQGVQRQHMDASFGWSSSKADLDPTPVGPRDWTKGDWRKLDACFTDERLILGSRQGLGHEHLASADDVRPEDVVNRFIEEFVPLGSDLGGDWSRYVTIFDI